MSILIKGMEMPKGRPVCIVIDAAGQAQRYDLNNDRYADDKLFEAVPVQPHGRLIDADKIGLTNFEIILCQKGNPFKNALEMLLEKIENAPTIIPAEEGE